SKPGGVVDQELGPGVPSEDGVLCPAAGGRHVKALAVPDEPIRCDMRTSVLSDASHDDVARLGQEGVDLVQRGHAGNLLVPQTVRLRCSRPRAAPAKATMLASRSSEPV